MVAFLPQRQVQGRNLLLDLAPLNEGLQSYRQGMDRQYQTKLNEEQRTIENAQAADATQFRNKSFESQQQNQQAQLGIQQQRLAMDKDSHRQNTEINADKLKSQRIKSMAGIAQLIDQEQDPAKRQQMWEAYKQRDPKVANALPEQYRDPVNGPKFLLAEARGYDGPASAKEQAQTDLYRAQAEKARQPNGGKGMSARGEKAVLESDDLIQSNQSAIQNLDRALAINQKAYSSFGPLNDSIGYATSFTGSEAGTATQELDNIVKGNALETLKATFGGMPTEGERKVLIEVQGSLNQPAQVREGIYRRAREMAERRLGYNQWKAQALRDGTYFTQTPPQFNDFKRAEGGGSQQPQQPQGGDPLSEARAAIQRGADPNAVAERLRQNGIDPGGL